MNEKVHDMHIYTFKDVFELLGAEQDDVGASISKRHRPSSLVKENVPPESGFDQMRRTITACCLRMRS